MTLAEPRAVAEILDEARRRLNRLSPHEAFRAQQRGALVVDTRPRVNRDTEGTIPGSLSIDRNVLEWRLDPLSDARLAIATYDLHVIVVCNEGYASSLAAISLQDIGVRHATDLIGGYRAWRAVGLPVTPAAADT